MFCIKCGNEVNDDDIFCDKCGNKLKTHIEIINKESEENNIENKIITCPKCKGEGINNKIYFIGLFILVALSFPLNALMKIIVSSKDMRIIIALIICYFVYVFLRGIAECDMCKGTKVVLQKMDKVTKKPIKQD